MIDIKFNVPPYVDKAADYIQECVKNQKICGDGEYTKKCNAWIEERTGTGKCLLTTSCTHATDAFLYVCVHCGCVRAPRRDPGICGYPSGYHEH